MLSSYRLLATTTLVTAWLLGACGGAKPAPQVPQAPPAESTASEVPAESGEPEAPAAEPEASGEAAPAEAGGSEDAPAAEGGALSSGETRTMKVIQQTVLDNRDKFRACYDKVQANVPELQGDLTLSFVLDPAGKVREAAVNEERSTIKHEEVSKCAIGELKLLKFPPSSKGLDTKVTYPFNFNPR